MYIQKSKQYFWYYVVLKSFISFYLIKKKREKNIIFLNINNNFNYKKAIMKLVWLYMIKINIIKPKYDKS
jgi:hypothetical protein